MWCWCSGPMAAAFSTSSSAVNGRAHSTGAPSVYPGFSPSHYLAHRSGPSLQRMERLLPGRQGSIRFLALCESAGVEGLLGAGASDGAGPRPWPLYLTDRCEEAHVIKAVVGQVDF